MAGRQAWRVLVWALACTGAAALAVALVQVSRTRVDQPWIVLGGIAATIALNRVYVVIHRHGDVREGVDVAEVPLVALALVLPPEQALLAFALGSIVLELPLDRAPVKKAFNVGVRLTGAGALLVPVLAVGGSGITATRVGAVVVGAGLYWAIGAVCTSLLLTMVQDTKLRTVLLAGLRARLLVWGLAVVVGITGAAAVEARPVLLLGFAALIALLSATAEACTRAQHDAERLQGVLDATAGIQAAVGRTAQDAAVLGAAHELLPWRDVVIRETPPQPGEVARPLPSQDGAPRWLLAQPRPDADPWSSRDDLVLDTLANTASVTIELADLQARIAELALVDPLTSLGNRRRLDQELRRLCSHDAPFGVVLLDLDGFKEINDRLGHEVGDAVLEQVAARLQSGRREGDVVTRLGGDEFVLLLPDVADQPTARAVVDRIAAAIAEPMQVGPWRLRVRTSGGASLFPTHGDAPQALLRRADEAMYADKQSRSAKDKDLVALWQPPDRRAGDHPGTGALTNGR